MGFYRDLIVVGFTVSLCFMYLSFYKRRVVKWIEATDNVPGGNMLVWFLVQIFFAMYIGTVTSWLD
jgi:hypothetical protein